MVAVAEAPDEQSMLAGLFNIAAAGNVRSETLRAFTAAELSPESAPPPGTAAVPWCGPSPAPPSCGW